VNQFYAWDESPGSGRRDDRDETWELFDDAREGALGTLPNPSSPLEKEAFFSRRAAPRPAARRRPLHLRTSRRIEDEFDPLLDLEDHPNLNDAIEMDLEDAYPGLSRKAEVNWRLEGYAPPPAAYNEENAGDWAV